MALVQVGKYKRPGIFFEEFDQSILPNPPVPGSISTLVIGFSKKGPVNTPVLISNKSDLNQIFGPLDRNLERNGSYFHRTVSKMLESSPVLSMSLLATDDTLDLIEYQSLATATDKMNDIVRQIPYRKVFDTSSFWKRDSITFMDTVDTTIFENGYIGEPDGQDRLLSITNLSNKYVSVFAYKSQLTGYNQSLLEYYGSSDKVPTYVNPLDYASDYLLDILVVAGDWSNYAQLSVDTKWSAYFDSTGLLKSKVSTFAQDRNVNTLAFYEGVSLIPFFSDQNGKNIFIETIINNDTDKTGLFCAFNAEKLEKNFPNGMVDLIGNNLVQDNSLIGIDQDSINFLSYQEKITEKNPFLKTPLDIAGGPSGQQVIAFGPSISNLRVNNLYSSTQSSRTAYMAENIINGVILSNNTGATGAGHTSSLYVEFQVGTVSLGGPTFSQPYYVYNGTLGYLLGGTGSNGPVSVTFSISNSYYTTYSATSSYYTSFYIDTNSGNIEMKQTTTPSLLPALDSTSLSLGYLGFSISPSGYFVQTSPLSWPYFEGVGITHSQNFNANNYDLVYGTDYSVTPVSGGKFTVTFLGTAKTDTLSDRTNKKIYLFHALVSLLDSSNIHKMTMLSNISTQEKISLSNASVSNINTASTLNKSFTLDLGTGSTPTDILNGNLIFYKLDNEFFSGSNGVETKSTLGTGTYGVAGRYSTISTSFKDGLINTGDYFYRNLNKTQMRIIFQNDVLGNPVIAFSQTPTTPNGLGFDEIDMFIIPDSTLNYKTFEKGSSSTYSVIDPSTGITLSNTYNVFSLNKPVVTEVINSTKTIWDAATKYYIQGSSDFNGDLSLSYTDDTLVNVESIPQSFNPDITVISDLTNLTETLEIFEPTGYTPQGNKVLFVGGRYSEIRIGDFLEAYVDEATLYTGQVGRRLTRIINKKAWSVDPTYSEITCDAKIKKYTFNGKMQTQRYTTIDSYAKTYKSITLKGFNIRQYSMPDGTEDTQNLILNMVAKGTPLYNALTNKDAIDFRYLIDSFGLGLTEASKQQLVDICGDRLDCLGFINMPSIRDFKNSKNPYFLNSDGSLSTSYIAQGGNPDNASNFLYSFATGKGVSSVGYFTPYVIINDNGRPTELPPSMFVATTYMRKQLALETSVVPWTIAAGVTNGKILGIQSLEINYTLSDIENLNLAQINPIVYKRNRGFVIETENTAQTIYKSALSYLHVREVLIELERELGAMLLDFQWKFNTATIRSEIKLKADVICEKYVNRNGLYNYFNKCDEENNTQDLIDRQIGVLDTYVEPIKGMGVIVNNITILRTGAISAGGFA
jgi:hypothetical protein